MPDNDDPKPDESINTMFQLVVRVATDAASSIATSSTTLANFEGRVAGVEKGFTDLKSSIDALKTAVENHTSAIKEKNEEVKERKAAWRDFLARLLTPQFIIQIITIVGVGLGLWTQIPGSSIPLLPDTHESSPVPSPEDPGTIEP